MAVLEIVEYPAQVLKQAGGALGGVGAGLEKLVPRMFGKEYPARGEQEGEEGCLSVGKIHAPLRRAARVRLRAQDARGEAFEREAAGLAARCFQHETDHCDGFLFIDRLSPLRRD